MTQNTTKRYEIGETYWASIPKAGKNKQSSGILIGWTDKGEAILYSKRYGEIKTNIEDLNAHN